MKSMNVCVVGCGYVGLVTGACLAEIGHRVRCVDSDTRKVKALLQGEIPIFEEGLNKLVHQNVKKRRLSFFHTLAEGMAGAQIVFIAVGTPPRQDGSADLTFIEAVAREIASHLKGYTVIAEKSTVPVETGEQVERTIMRYNRHQIPFDVVSNPEFLREGTAVKDFLKPDRIVIGTKSKRAEKVMTALYAPLKAKTVMTDLKSAELIKHASNSFLATKISFMNSVARVCELVGADVKQVAEGMGLDPRIGKAFLHAGIGFGGFCLPKDLEAFYYISHRVGYDFDILRVVKEVNEQQRSQFVKKIEEAVWILKGKTIAVLGIAFKPHTDDIRFAPAIDIIDRLQAHGARIRVFDPVAMDKAKAVLKQVTFCKNAYEAVEGSDCLALVTEWPEFRDLDFRRIKRLMTNPILIDGRNLYQGAKMKELGFDYHGMGPVSMMRVLITGGAGFIGSHLCDYFLSKGHAVVAMDNLLTGDVKNIEHLFGHDRFQFIRHDVTNFIHVPGRVNAVLHFASPASPQDYLEYPIPTLKVGALGTHKALGLAKEKGATFLLASTSEVYGDPLVNPQPESYWGNVNPVGPRGVYDEAKRFAEAMAMAYHRYHGMPVRIVRIFNTYGPRMRVNDGRAIPNFIAQALRSKPITIYGDGSQTRSFCYVDDLVKGLYRLLLTRIDSPVNIGNPHEMTLLELAQLVRRLSKSKSRLVHRPLPQDDPKVRRPDIRVARTKLRWEPKVPVEVGLAKTVSYFRAALKS